MASRKSRLRGHSPTLLHSRQEQESRWLRTALSGDTTSVSSGTEEYGPECASLQGRPAGEWPLGMHSQGWLFDVYPAQTTMVVWLHQEDGSLLRLEDAFRPRLYAHGRSDDLQA